MNATDFAIVIPAYNEERTILTIVSKVKEYGFPIVVDDGSIDNTFFLASNAGAIVIRHTRNLGYDAALQSGLLKAIELQFKFAITMDADGQHFPEVITLFKNALTDGFPVVIGIRPKFQRFSEKIFSIFTKWLWKIDDPLCGIKGYSLRLVNENGYFDSYKSIGTEFVIKCAKSSIKIKSIPILVQKRNGTSKFGTGVIPNLKILRSLVLALIVAKPLYRKQKFYNE